jgi:hypothetical protein
LLFCSAIHDQLVRSTIDAASQQASEFNLQKDSYI